MPSCKQFFPKEAKMRTAFWLDVLKIELDAIGADDLIEPKGEVEDGEEVVGLVPEELRKLYTRAQQSEAEALRFVADLRIARNDKDQKHAIEKSIAVKAKAETMSAIFWLCIRDEYKLWGPDVIIGVRKSWNVVRKKDQDSPIPDFLRKLLGLGD
ncbi:MAG TPA: hypothetical protein VJB92_00460 [Candidatus Paceibacterota bacterium]